MRDFVSEFNQTKALADKYGLNSVNSETALAELSDFKVTVPLVGGFSTGKSSLINALLGEKLLSTNITPETAVPTEITAGNNTVILTDKDGNTQTMPLAEFDASALRADTYSLVRIETDNPFSQKIPTVKLVDMPGFDSGIDVHNQAIDNYMPKSLAYILAVAADEGTLRESIIAFLNELKLYDVPVYVVITKCGKVQTEDVERTAAHLKETVQRFMGVERVMVACTNARGREVSVNGFADILLQVQSQSEEIRQKYFTSKLLSVCAELEQYLSDRLKRADLSEDQLILDRQKLEHDLENLAKDKKQLNEKLTHQAEECCQAIREKIKSDLSASASTLENMLLQGIDVREKINTIVRYAIVSTMQHKLEPQVRQYVREVEKSVRDFAYDGTKVELDSVTLRTDEEISSGLKNILVPAASALVTGLVGAFAGAGSILGPIGAAVGALAGALITSFIDRSKREKQEAERKALAAEKVQQIIDSVSTEAGAKAETGILSYINEVISKADKQFENKIDIVEKALKDTMEKIHTNAQEKADEMAMLTADLEKVQELHHGI